ncbi:MAG TPA: tetratricopeptide repeat protein [Bryobacteraceae bacterium]|nr:tetratricopeptide repeat protein [Bryobacteraceae bacterium]
MAISAFTDPSAARLPLERRLYYLLAGVALVYAFAAGLKTLSEFDLGWQLASGRWIVGHHQIPSTEVFSYTAAGKPWIYPVGSGVLFYGVYLLGGYALLSWLAPMACVGTVALLLRRGSAVTAALTLLAIPLIAARTTVRAEIFTVVLFAAMLSLLWQQHESGRARLWLLPLLMAAWVNLHPGFLAGLGLVGAYVMLESLDMLSPGKRIVASARLSRSAFWLIATCVATLANPWGWGVYQVLWRQNDAMTAHSQLIAEWAPMPLHWAQIASGLSLRDGQEFYLLLLFLILAVSIAVTRWQPGAAILMAAAVFFPLRHERFTALFSIVLVVVAGAVLTPFARNLWSKLNRPQLGPVLASVTCVPLLWLAGSRTIHRITDRTYLTGTNLMSFGSGLSWWFPEAAADFVESENLPGQVFSGSNEGGYLAWRLGPKYNNYIDSRAIPFGTEQMLRAVLLKSSPPDAPQWQEEIQRYNINTILVPIGRFSALQSFPVLKQFCDSNSWTPVYLDEVAAVFVRRTPETETLTSRLQVNCSTAPLPKVPSLVAGSKAAFQQWANAASVLHALGRDSEALTATSKALTIFPDSGYLHFVRGHMFQDAGRSSEAEQDYLLATKLEPNLAAPWSALAAYYQEQGRFSEAIRAWENAANVSRSPWEPLQSLGYANLQARRPREALTVFQRTADSLPAKSDLVVDNAFLANVAHGRARAWYRLGDLSRAISFEEEAVRLLPYNADLWQQLASLYDQAGRHEEANQVRAHAATHQSGGTALLKSGQPAN